MHFIRKPKLGRIDGEAAGDRSGRASISNDGSFVAIGGPHNNNNGNFSGHVRVFQNINGNWTQLGQDLQGSAEDDQLGSSVSINSNGSIVATGAPGLFFGTEPGYARVYQFDGNGWIQLGQDIEGESAGDLFGIGVSLSGDGSTRKDKFLKKNL